MRPEACSPARRRILKTAGAAAFTSALGLAPARAQTPRRYAVVSFVGDQLVVVYAGLVTGSNIDPNRRRTVADPHGAMDQFALAATGRALEAGGRASASLLALPPSPMHEQAERWVSDPTLSLPGRLVDALEQQRASHLVLLTKHRADASIPLRDTHLGTGKLRGLGYYVDVHANVRIVESGATGTGMLAPYAYLTLTLADASTGMVLRQHSCTAARPYAVAASATAFDPWDLLTPEQKVSRLRILLVQELAREVPLLVAG